MPIDRRALLRALAISTPIALATAYNNYLVWVIAGFPLGTVPPRSELSLGVVLLWRLASILLYALYLLYGGLYVWFFLRHGNQLSSGRAALGGALTGLIPAVITRLLYLISDRSDAEAFLAQFLAAHPTYPEERARAIAALATALSFIFTVTIRVLLSASGAAIYAGMMRRRVARQR